MNTLPINEYTVVVFDLDETMGYFVELGIFWLSLQKLMEKEELTNVFFCSLLDLYPEFLRPNIINILLFLKNKKTNNLCQKVMIYTNNQGNHISWANMIKIYFENKINYNLFDQIISAFKINGERIELNRSHHSKTHSDLINCTKIPEDTKICFIDDTYYEGMNNENIYYINIKPYEFQLPFDILIKRFFNSELWLTLPISMNNDTNNEKYKHFLFDNLLKYRFNYHTKTEFSYKVDKLLSKKVLYHLKCFFNKTNKPRPNKQYPSEYYTKYKSKTKKKEKKETKKNNKTKKNKPLISL